MKYVYYIITLIIGLITSFFIWMYIQRANLNYNTEGRFFDTKNGVIYNEQVKELYGVLALFGLILSGLCIGKLIKKKCANK